jgi:hypothetical protein
VNVEAAARAILNLDEGIAPLHSWRESLDAPRFFPPTGRVAFGIKEADSSVDDPEACFSARLGPLL